MRKISMVTALAGAAITLSACSGGTEEAAEDTTAEAPVADTSEAEAASTVVDANTATEEQLAGMEGMSPELAAAIVAGQPYENVSVFNATLLETLSEEEAATVRETLFVPVNLNTASEADIKLIPGMTDKMVYEFLEYRPYEDMAEFDREIGKYVDEAEVARFRSYVTL
jgi:DNA uptake protein ComE-like DNA-binding protein